MLGAVTVTVALPLCPSLIAVIVTAPTATPVTSPLLTIAIPGALDVHVIERPGSGLPFASRGVAVSTATWPIATLADAGLTVTEATGGGVHGPRATLQTVSLPPVVLRPRLLSALTPACSVRKTKPLASSCSGAGGGDIGAVAVRRDVDIQPEVVG